MNICFQDTILFTDVVLTKEAQHEEEMMKSDFVRLSWNTDSGDVIPVGAYIVPFPDMVDFRTGEPMRFSLLEPYTPEQKSECEWHYEPLFQHPKMYLGTVTFKRPTKDSEGDDIVLLEWPYTGFVGTLLGYLCDTINDALDITEESDKFSYTILGEVPDIISISFSTVDILSALTNMASQQECEWHIDWQQKRVYYGHVTYNREEVGIPVLKVGDNIQIPSIRNTKDGYWNAFEPQGSTRNVSRRAASGEYVQASVRLALDRKTYYDVDTERYPGGIQFPDGIVYTDGQGNIITKAEFEQSGQTPLVRSVLFDDVYPRMTLYVYNARHRDRYLLDEDGNKVVDYYDSHGNPVYKKYSVWYVRLAYPVKSGDNVTRWVDFTLDENVTTAVITGNNRVMVVKTSTTSAQWVAKVRTTVSSSVITENITGATIIVNGHTYSNMYITRDGDYLSISLGIYVSESVARNSTIVKSMEADLAASNDITIIGEEAEKFPQSMWLQSTSGSSQIIDGKKPIIAFQANTYYKIVGYQEGVPIYEYAETSPLAGQGDGDGDGNYGFEINYHKEADTIAPNPEEGDTGMNVLKGDYEIIFQQKDNYILPTTVSMGLIPKGVKVNNKEVTDLNALSDKNDGQKGNIISMYNIVIGEEYYTSARNELLEETKKYIANLFTDNKTYTFKSDPISFEDNAPSLYIGRNVIYDDGRGYTLDTRVMKLITKIDFPFEQEISVGNEVIKGSQTQLKEQVRAIVSGSVGSGGGMNQAQVRTLLENWVTPRFLSKLNEDVAKGKITFEQGLEAVVESIFNGIVNRGNIKSDTGDIPVFTTDTTFQQLVSILGNLSVGGDTDIAGNATVDGILKALARIISNQIESDNYTGDGAFDTGFQLKKNGADGITSLIVDNLFVRMKAIFNELEIRKISYAGGNIIFSHAGSKVVRVNPLYDDGRGGYYEWQEYIIVIDEGYYDENSRGIFITDMESAYDAQTRGITLEGVHLEPNPEPRPSDDKIVAWRCYLLKDDGTTQTENWWRVDDQARCQTFNIKAGVYENVSNTFYWRKVLEVGTMVLEDNKLYDFIDLSRIDCYTGTTVEGIDVSNMISVPQAGDQLVQMGNRTDTDRQGFISIEVSGEYAPAFKMYKNVSGYTLENKRKIIISPKLSDFKARRFVIETDYDIQVIPMERGDWSYLIPDEQGKRRCYYYDLLQNNGASWLCIVSEGTYTTVEPGDATPEQKAAWRIYAQKGEKGDKGDSVSYDAEHSSIGYAYSTKGSPESGRDYPSDITSWSATIPAVQKGKYLWTKDTTAYNNAGTIVYTTTYGVEYQPNDGESVQIDSSRTFIKYCKQSKAEYTGQHPADSAFSTDYPSSLGQGDYLWILNQVAYVGVTNPLKSYSVSMLGTDGGKGDPGADGYTIHFAYATSADGSQNFSTTNFSGATYIGTYRDQNADDSQVYTDYTWTQWKGSDGASVTVDTANSKTEYATSNQGTDSSLVTGWSTTMPTVAQGAFLWTRVTIAFSDGTSTISYGVSYNAEDGTDGTSVTITSKSVTYAVTQNGTQPADSAFTYDSLPPLSLGDYLWTKTEVNYSDGNSTKSYNVSRLGTDGSDGQPGTNGYTTHFAYATSADGSQGFSTTPFTGATYIGTYSDQNTQDSQTYTDYTWTQWRGSDGVNGVNTATCYIENPNVFVPVDTDGKVKTENGQAFTATIPFYAIAGGMALAHYDCTMEEENNGNYCQFGGEGAYDVQGNIFHRTQISEEDNRWMISIENAYIDGRGIVIPGNIVFAPSDVIITIPNGSTLNEHKCRITVKALDTNNNEYTVFGAIEIKGRRDGENGDPGEDAVNVIVTPASLIVNQSLDNPNNLSSLNERIIFSIMKGSTSLTVTKIDNIVVERYNPNTDNIAKLSVTGSNSNYATVTAIGQYTQNNKSYYFDNGYFTCRVAYTDGGTTKYITGVKVKVYANLLGTWKETVENDVDHAIATKKYYFEDENGNVVAHETIGDYIKSSTENISTLTKKVDEGKNLIDKLTRGWVGQDGSSDTVTYGNRFRIEDSNHDLYSPVVTLEAGKDYCFSAYFDFNPGTDSAYIIAPVGNYANGYELYNAQGGQSIEIQWTRVDETDRYYFTFRVSEAKMFAFNYYNVNYCYLYRPQLELGTVPTEFDTSSYELSSQVKQTADGLQVQINGKASHSEVTVAADNINATITNKLGETGININGENRTIHLKAENTTIDGDVVVGSLKTKPDANGFYTEINGGMNRIAQKVNNSIVEVMRWGVFSINGKFTNTPSQIFYLNGTPTVVLNCYGLFSVTGEQTVTESAYWEAIVFYHTVDRLGNDTTGNVTAVMWAQIKGLASGGTVTPAKGVVAEYDEFHCARTITTDQQTGQQAITVINPSLEGLFYSEIGTIDPSTMDISGGTPADAGYYIAWDTDEYVGRKLIEQGPDKYAQVYRVIVYKIGNDHKIAYGGYVYYGYEEDTPNIWRLSTDDFGVILATTFGEYIEEYYNP